MFKWLTEIKENSASAIQSGKLWIKWNHVLENSMMQNNPNIAIIVWADAEIIALWEPILPGMSRKYFGDLPLVLSEYKKQVVFYHKKQVFYYKKQKNKKQSKILFFSFFCFFYIFFMYKAMFWVVFYILYGWLHEKTLNCPSHTLFYCW